jgi:hypothetical protein
MPKDVNKLAFQYKGKSFRRLNSSVRGLQHMRLRPVLLVLLISAVFLLQQVASTSVAARPFQSNPFAKARKQPIIQQQHQPSAAWVDGLKNGLASALSAACVKTILQPIDAIKTMQQFSQGRLSVIGACREIYQRQGGLTNFYAGLGVTVFGSMPGVALYFGVYSSCKKKLLNTTFGRNNKVLAIAISAAIGNSVASFSRVPYEVMKQQLQTGAYKSTWQAIGAVVSSPDWLRLLFPRGGIAVQMIRDVPYAVVTLMLYESLQASFGTKTIQFKGDKSKAWDFVFGGICGGVGSWVTNPLDVVKTRLQTNSASYGGSVLQCTSDIWQKGGAAVFMRGSVPRLMHKVPANAFFFLFYEFFRRLLKVNDDVDTRNSTTGRRAR